jgi:hypothetical protein
MTTDSPKKPTSQIIVDVVQRDASFLWYVREWTGTDEARTLAVCPTKQLAERMRDALSKTKRG